MHILHIILHILHICTYQKGLCIYCISKEGVCAFVHAYYAYQSYLTYYAYCAYCAYATYCAYCCLLSILCILCIFCIFCMLYFFFENSDCFILGFWSSDNEDEGNQPSSTQDPLEEDGHAAHPSSPSISFGWTAGGCGART